MYKGKFGQKGRDGTDVQSLLEQRRSSPATPPPAQAPQKAPQPLPAQAKNGKPKKKRAPRLGGTIFYTLYFLFIALFCLGTFLGLRWLDGWLRDFEASQPTVKAQQVFEQLFTDPNWEDLYTASGVEDSPYEGKDAFAAYMDQRVGGQSLTYLETSAGLSGDKKYNVRLGNEKIATFTLVDKNPTTGAITQIPDWQLGQVELFFDRSSSYRIVKLDGHTALVNGVELEQAHILQIVTPMLQEYLPEGVSAPRMCTQEVTGLFRTPTVTIFDKDGTEMAVTYDEQSRTFTEETIAAQIPEDLKAVALNAAETNALWMAAEITDKDKLAQCFDPNTDAYRNILAATVEYVQKGSSREFTDVSVTDYCRYHEDLFSVRVEMNLSVTRASGSVKNWPYSKTMLFQKKPSGNWLCILSDNRDLTEPVGRVRLTFFNGEQEISSDFFRSDAKELITPLINAPQGMVFAGWARQIQNDSGQTVLEILFQPDSSGHVTLTGAEPLEPMTLYAHFEPVDTSEGGN